MQFNKVVVMSAGAICSTVGEIEFPQNGAPAIVRPNVSAFNPNGHEALEQIAPQIREQIERGQVCGDAGGFEWKEGSLS